MTPVAPEKLGEVWDWVRPGLVAIIARNKCNYIPEDVYLALKKNAAYLYVVEDKKGFCVFEKISEPDGTVVLFIWCGWGSLYGIRNELFAEMNTLAKGIGATCIRVRSPRKSWRKYFELKEYVFERPVV